MVSIILYVVLMLCFVGKAFGSEREILSHIFNDYDKRVRPVRNISTTTVVGVQLRIISLLEVNGQEEYIKLAVFFRETWNDEYLTWDPSQFDGIEYIRAPISLVWLPDFAIITTSMKSEDFVPTEYQMLGIHYDGLIDYSFPFVMTNYCPMKSELFPFDSQECIIKVQSWKYTSDFILMEHIYTNDTSARNPNTMWDVLPYTNKSVDFVREGAADYGSFRQVQYFVTIQRKFTYYIWVIIVPTYIISALSIAGIFAPFSNSGEREEKVTLGLTTLLTLAVILSLVTLEMPKATKLPILGIFILTQIVLCAFCMIFSVLVMFLHQRATTRAWSLPNWLSKACCFHDRGRHFVDIQFSSNNKKLNDDHQSDNKDALLSLLTRVRNWLDKIEEEQKLKNQWAIICDRIDLILLLIFQLLNIASLAVVLVHD